MTFKTNATFINSITVNSAVESLMSEQYIGTPSEEKSENKNADVLLSIIDDVLDILSEEELSIECDSFLMTS